MAHLFRIDGEALVRYRRGRGLTQETLAHYIHARPNLIARLEDPNNYRRRGIKDERKPYATHNTIKRLARQLRVNPYQIAPDIKQETPEPNPPKPPTELPPRSGLAPWRGREQMADVRQRRIELLAPSMEDY